MSDKGKQISADQILKKIVWRHTVSLSHTMEQSTTWSITGVAAIVALFISNLDSAATLVSSVGLRWFLISFTASLVFGAISKQIGMALVKGLDLVEKMEGMLYSEQGLQLISQMSTSPRELIKEIAEPFFWPISSRILKGGLKGIDDYLSSDKRFVKMFCIQLIFVYLHGITAAAGLIVIACSIV
jgi:phage shock protein PspC (stress-responsive transcriptional regulator)